MTAEQATIGYRHVRLGDLRPVIRLTALAASATGSATRVDRAMLLVEPLSLDHQEVTDKGIVNQREVLVRRADLVEELHADARGAHVLLTGAIA